MDVCFSRDICAKVQKWLSRHVGLSGNSPDCSERQSRTYQTICKLSKTVPKLSRLPRNLPDCPKNRRINPPTIPKLFLCRTFSKNKYIEFVFPPTHHKLHLHRILFTSYRGFSAIDAVQNLAKILGIANKHRKNCECCPVSTLNCQVTKIVMNLGSQL